MAESSSVVSPNLGLYYDKPSIALNERQLEEGLNFRVKEGTLQNLNLGWDQFGTFELNGPCQAISSFQIRGGAEHLLFITPTDIYRYQDEDTVVFLTPVYATGTVTATSTAVDFTGQTNIGDMTGGAGIDTLFDDDTTETLATSATKASATTAYAGRSLPSAIAIGGCDVYGSDDQGFVDGATPAVTISLYAKNGVPANSTDGTLLGTLTFTDATNARRTIQSKNTTTTFTHVWVKIDHNGSAATMACAELDVFPPVTAIVGSGTNWDPNAKAGDYIAIGSATHNATDIAWAEITTVTDDTNLVVVAAAYAPAGTAYTIRRTFTGDVTDTWTYDIFLGNAATGDLWLASNGLDDLVTWNGTDNFATLQEGFALTKIKALAVYNNMVIYGGFEEAGETKPNSIQNSGVGTPLTLTGLSEQFKVHANPEGIHAMYVLGDNLVIYSPRTIILAQFVGDPLIFTFRQAAAGTGPLSPNAIADYGDRHVFLGFDSMYDFDGVTLAETDNHVWREAIRRNDPLRRHFAFAHFDEENGDLIWVLAQTSDAGSGDAEATPEIAYVQHYLEEMPTGYDLAHSRRQLPFITGGYYFRQEGLTWDEITETWVQLNFAWNDQFFASAFPLSLMGSVDGKVYTINTSQNQDDGTGLESFVRFGKRAAGDSRMRGLVRRIYPYVQNFNTDLLVTLYLSDHASGPATISETYTFDQDLPEGGHFVSAFRRGRFFQLEFGTEGPSEPWVLEGYDVQIDPGGYR